ncbi:MAG TPA: PspC domain-containing protein [Candidatus Saccharimonadales bacterium]
MNEITRIHLAKVPYEIEINAKKDLQRYIDSLAAYAETPDVLEDIEIRMTELLEERHILRDGLITATDIDALRKQLGEPKDFADPVTGSSDDEPASDMAGHTRKLFRDSNTAIVGGVLSGLAQYFKINALWTRLAFLILLIISAGTFFLVYVVLWIFIPPVRSAADKLQLQGKPVTAAAIHALAEKEGPFTQGRDKRILSVLRIIVGIGFTFAAIGALIATAFGGFYLITQTSEILKELTINSSVYFTSGGLAILSGLLLAVLFGIVAHAAFTARIVRKHIISACIVTVLGLAAFGTAVGIGIYSAHEVEHKLDANAVERIVPLEGSKDAIKSIELKNDSKSITNFSYIVSDDAPHYVVEQRLLEKQTVVLPTITYSGEKMTVKLPTIEETSRWSPSAYRVTMYGPALTNLTVADNSTARYTADSQQEMSVQLNSNSHLSVVGLIDNLSLTLPDTANFDGTEASINRVVVNSTNGGEVMIGTVQSLDVTARSSCGSSDGVFNLVADQIMSPSMMINGQTVPKSDFSQHCIHVTMMQDVES